MIQWIPLLKIIDEMQKNTMSELLYNRSDFVTDFKIRFTYQIHRLLINIRAFNF